MVAYSFKRRFVNPILVGLGLDPIEADRAGIEPKRQTIRAIGKRRHARPDEIVQLYHGMRTRQCFMIGSALCSSVEPIDVYLKSDVIRVGALDRPDAPVRSYTAANGASGMLDAFARADGFGDWGEMKEFWREEHGDLARLGPWTGLLIKWRPLSRELGESADD